MLPLTIVENFFDNSKPCPPDVKDCDKLRIEYENEVNSAKSTPGGCSPCKLRGIRNRYIAKITNG